MTTKDQILKDKKVLLNTLLCKLQDSGGDEGRLNTPMAVTTFARIEQQIQDMFDAIYQAGQIRGREEIIEEWQEEQRKLLEGFSYKQPDKIDCQLQPLKEFRK